MIKNLHALWHFSRKYRQFLQIANLSQGLITEHYTFSKRGTITLKHLNGRKMSCQMKIGDMALPSIANCAACTSGCCGGPSSSYFTPIDYWLSRHGSLRIHTYRQLPQEPFHHMTKRRVTELSQRVRSVRGTYEVTQRSALEQCQYLSAHGCVLPHNERPIQCHMAVCSRLRRNMDDVTMAAYIQRTGELYSIARETFEVLKKEAGLPPEYGVVSLVMTF